MTEGLQIIPDGEKGFFICEKIGEQKFGCLLTYVDLFVKIAPVRKKNIQDVVRKIWHQILRMIITARKI